MDSELSFRTRGNFQLDMFSQDPINNSHILALVLPLYKMGNTKSDFKVNSTVHQRCGTHLNRNIGDWSHNPRQSLWTPLYRWCFGQLQSHWIICARSLHYQFLSWYAWTYPYLIGSANTNIVIGVALWTIHEWCWNVYPSTFVSSLALVTCNLIVLGIYWFSSCTPQPSTPSDNLQEHSDNEKKTK